jgi:hypothetical protein
MEFVFFRTRSSAGSPGPLRDTAKCQPEVLSVGMVGWLITGDQRINAKNAPRSRAEPTALFREEAGRRVKFPIPSCRHPLARSISHQPDISGLSKVAAKWRNFSLCSFLQQPHLLLPTLAYLTRTPMPRLHLSTGHGHTLTPSHITSSPNKIPGYPMAYSALCKHRLTGDNT